MSKYIKADYLKAIMKNDRLLQGNCEYELWAQQVNKYVDSLPSIELADRKTEPSEHRDCINCEDASDCAKCRGIKDEPQTERSE